MASTFIFLTKFFLIFVIHQRVNANEHPGNCEVNRTTGVILFQDPPKNLKYESDISDVIQVDEATSSSLSISWQLHEHDEGNMAGSSMLTLRYCNSTGELDNVETLDNLTCPIYKEATGLNGTSYILTGLEPFEWYNLTLLSNGNTVASKIASTAPLSPEYYGVYMTCSPEKEILEISVLPVMNRTVPSDLCFSIIQTECSTPDCSSPSLKCFDPGSKINNFKAEDLLGIGLVSRGRGLCSQPTLYTPIILNSTHGMMDMPLVSSVMGAVIGTSVFILLSSVALLLFLNFICKGIGCLGKKGMNIAEDRNVTQRNADNQYEDLQNRDVSGTGYMSMKPISTVAATNNSDDYMKYETIPSGAEECPALLSKATECPYVNIGQRSTLTNKKQDTTSSWEDEVTYF